MTDSVAQDQIRSYFERWQRLEAEKATVSTDLKELFAEAKAMGFNTKVMRAVFRGELADKAEQDEFEALCDLYRAALQTPRAHPARAHIETLKNSDAASRVHDTVEASGVVGKTEPQGSQPAGSGSDKIPAPIIRKTAADYRTHCLNPSNCAASGLTHCHACTKALAESEAA